MTTRTATCSCGQLRATCEGEPVRVSICHCHACQRRTGSPFAQQARWPRDAVTIEGRATSYVLVGDSGNKAIFRFCPVCGATVWYQPEQMPDMVIIPVGAFADSSFPPPTISVYHDVRKHPWVGVPDDVERN